MADNTTLNTGSGGDTIASDDVGGVKHQRVKIGYGTDGTATDVSTASPLPVGDAGGSLTVDDGGAALSIDDNGSSLTVDAPIATPVGVRLSDGTSAIGSTAQRLHVDDGGSSLTVDSADLAAIKTAVEIIDNIVAGTEAQVDVVTQPARVATTDTITAKLATDKLHDGATALTPKFAVIDAATSGDNTLLAAVTSKKIRVVSLFIVAAGAVNVRFESGTGGAALTGQMNLAANGGFVLPFNPVGWFESASGVLLNLELSAAVSVDGSLGYVEV